MCHLQRGIHLFCCSYIRTLMYGILFSNDKLEFSKENGIADVNLNFDNGSFVMRRQEQLLFAYINIRIYNKNCITTGCYQNNKVNAC